MNTEIIKCFKCQHPLDIEEGTKIMRGDECPKCMTPLRCCRMCIHFEPSAYNQCKELIAERILDKEKANFCSYFVFAINNSNKEDNKSSLLNNANSLFKD